MCEAVVLSLPKIAINNTLGILLFSPATAVVISS
jgi:hypothetical protein